MFSSQAEAEGLTLLKADNKSGYFGVCLNQPGQSKPYQAAVRRGGKEEGAVPPMPPGAFVKEEGVVPPMPPDAVVKREHAVVVKEEERSDGRAKRRRSQ